MLKHTLAVAATLLAVAPQAQAQVPGRPRYAASAYAPPRAPYAASTYAPPRAPSYPGAIPMAGGGWWSPYTQLPNGQYVYDPYDQYGRNVMTPSGQQFYYPPGQ